ncbi:MAG: cupredoxin family protein [Arenimonas sp.]
MKSSIKFFTVSALVLTLGFSMNLANAHGEKHASDKSADSAESIGHAANAKEAKRTIAVHMNDSMRFTPGSFNVKLGETIRIRITNDGKLPHEFVLGTEQDIAEHAEMMRQMPNMVHQDANAVRVAPGHTADLVWKFSNVGNFLYACLIPGHWEAGMRGTIKVSASKKS